MVTRHHVRALLACFIVSASTPALAADVVATTGVSTISPCPSFCGGAGRSSEFDIDGGPGFTSSYSSLANTDGNGQAAAALNGGSAGLPTLRAEVFSGADSRVGAEAAGMRKYAYSGATSNFTLDLTLDGDVIDPTTPPDSPDASLVANLVVVQASELDFSADYGTFAFEVVALDPAATLLDETTINFFSLGLFDTGPQSVTQSVSFTLNDGDEIFVWANLVASGTRGGAADAFNTASLAFSTGNVAGLTAVPLPAGAWLLLSGMAIIATRRSRMRV